MKPFLLLLGFFLTGFCFGQTMNDTTYFPNGRKRIAHIKKESETSVSYKYQKQGGGTAFSKTRKSMIAGYVKYDENQELISEFTNERKTILLNDTLVYRNGEKGVVGVKNNKKRAVVYHYRGQDVKFQEESVRKKNLKGLIIYDSKNELLVKYEVEEGGLHKFKPVKCAIVSTGTVVGVGLFTYLIIAAASPY